MHRARRSCTRARRAKGAGRAADNQSVTGPSFRFRLERVRTVRERREKLAQQALAESIARLSNSQAGLRDAEAELESALSEQRSATAGTQTIGGAELRARQAFLERVQAERSRHQAALERGEQEVAEMGAKLAVAAADHEMLLRLRERRRNEHEREQARRETEANDEIASVRHRRSVA